MRERGDKESRRGGGCKEAGSVILVVPGQRLSRCSVSDGQLVPGADKGPPLCDHPGQKQGRLMKGERNCTGSHLILERVCISSTCQDSVIHVGL